ncbi:MAG: adenosylhomocysteinase [Bryobacteraceae bacterium]|nr:adenosylhomocysteinase [Bryobacteraceae bacterium]
MSANAQPGVNHDIRDPALAEAGRRRVDWAHLSMPVLQAVRKQFIKSQPLVGRRVGACLHVTAETANLAITLRDGGAEVVLCAANADSTDDEVAAVLVKDYGIATHAVRGADRETQRRHWDAVLETAPQVTLDDGCDLIGRLHTARQDRLSGVLGGTAEGLRGAAAEAVQYPVIAVDGSVTKRMFDNQLGTGQSTIDAILRATNLLLAGLTVVVAGYGPGGRGIAARARGLGANVLVTEVDPLRALEAAMDGFRVMSMTLAAEQADLVVTATGNKAVLAREHFEKLKNNAILCNAGHSSVEIDTEALERMASARREVRRHVEEYALRDGRRVYVLAAGRLINLATGEGHPASVMDVSFATQALAVEYLVKHYATLERRVHAAPAEIDRQVAKMKLESMGVRIDRLSLEQEKYLSDWPQGY